MTRDFFFGNAMNAIDAKNRLSIPAAYREVIERRGSLKTAMLAPHPDGAPCLVGYDRAHIESLYDELERRTGGEYSAEREALATRLFSAEPYAYDDAGRIVFSGVLRDYAEIDKAVLFVSAGPVFQMWNPALYLEHNQHNPVMLRIVNGMLKAKGVAA